MTLEKLLAKSVPELKERYLDREMAVPDGLLEALEQDGRNGMRELARKIRERRKKNRAEGQRLKHLLKFENELWAQGMTLIAGVDEAGMAPLAGPVVAAACILPKSYKLRGLNDSKQILDEELREELAVEIKRDALCWATGWAEVHEIDTLNIYHAGLLAMRRAVEGLSVVPEFCLVDARKIPKIPMPQRGIIHGDALSASIAAASIIAKTTRDRFMCEMDAKYPGYGFASHKGYPTPEHCTLLKKLGAVEIHRRSFNRVREVLGLLPVQEALPLETEPAPAPPPEAAPKKPGRPRKQPAAAAP